MTQVETEILTRNRNLIPGPIFSVMFTHDGVDQSMMVFKQFDWQKITVTGLNPPTALTYHRHTYLI